MKRFSRAASLFLLLAISFGASSCLAEGQDATVKRNTYLREGPSITSKKILLLKTADELELLDPEPTQDYYHIRTLDADEGYAYSKNITVKETAARLRKDLASPSGQVSDKIDSSWEKPAPRKSTLIGPSGNCPWNGDDSDPDTFLRKNRNDTAEDDSTEYHDVKWSSIATLSFPVAKPLRKNWTAEQIGEIAPFEGVALRTTGYLVAFKPQNRGSGEGTNCHFTTASETDTHMALVEDVGGAEKTSVVIEFTPRFLKAHPNWKKSVLDLWLNSDNPVRISGWLMLDPDHRNHLNRFRSTLWEIHPITKIEGWKDNQWTNIDSVK